MCVHVVLSCSGRSVRKSPIFDAIVCDPPYGIRAGAWKTAPVLPTSTHSTPAVASHAHTSTFSAVAQSLPSTTASGVPPHLESGVLAGGTCAAEVAIERVDIPAESNRSKKRKPGTSAYQCDDVRFCACHVVHALYRGMCDVSVGIMVVLRRLVTSFEGMGHICFLCFCPLKASVCASGAASDIDVQQWAPLQVSCSITHIPRLTTRACPAYREIMLCGGSLILGHVRLSH
jgi:hypothetical protein